MSSNIHVPVTFLIEVQDDDNFLSIDLSVVMVCGIDSCMLCAIITVALDLNIGIDLAIALGDILFDAGWFLPFPRYQPSIVFETQRKRQYCPGLPGRKMR